MTATPGVPTPRRRLLLAACLLAALGAGAAAQQQAHPTMKTEASPPTPRHPVTDTYHGVSVTDDYRWLENWDNPAVRAWTAAQNEHARDFLDNMPNVKAIGERLSVLLTSPSPRWSAIEYRPGVLFAVKSQPPKQQPFLITLSPSADPATERVLVDPNEIDQSGNTAIDFYVPSLDGKRVAVSLSQGGTERGDVHVYDVATGRPLDDLVPRVNGGTAGGSVAWAGDGRGFYYTRYPRPGERPEADLDFYQQVYFHTLGTPTSADTYVLGKEFPRIAETRLETSEGGQWVLASVANGDGGEFEHFVLAAATGRWTQITRFGDQVASAKFGRERGVLFLLSHQDAPRGKILRRVLTDAAASAPALVVPPGDAAIVDFVPTSTRVYVVDSLGGPSAMRVTAPQGGGLVPVAVPPLSSVDQVVALGGDEVLFRGESFIDPPAWYRVAPGSGGSAGGGLAPVRTKLVTTSPADFSGIEVERAMATSKDGTKVPVNILHRKGQARDGRTPTILYGYGGYRVNLSPSFDPARLVWLEQGGIYAVANLRGGSEYGEAWHRGGNLANKQNVFDDFAACARYLVEAGYTNTQKLGIEGGSNGGLLMGAELTQHPELFRAVVAHVGIYDMLRYDRFPNGAFNVTEYGNLSDPAQFRALFAYSPYHHVVNGTKYPAVLLMSGTADPRVNPADSRKMTARLQAATASGLPVLLRVSGGGHGIGASLGERVSQSLDAYGFFFTELGVIYRPQ